MGGYRTDVNVLDVTDCRGIRVTCSEETWYGKILGIRPFMKDWLPAIEEALKNPAYICEDALKKNRDVYYAFYKLGLSY